MVIGLSVRNSYSPNSPTALVVSGVLDALSAGVLLYTGLVELLAAEFLFHPEMKEAPTGKVLYALSCVILGAVVMAVLGELAAIGPQYISVDAFVRYLGISLYATECSVPAPNNLYSRNQRKCDSQAQPAT